MLPASQPHQKIVGFDITMYESSLMHELDPLNNLVRNHKQTFQTQLFATLLEKVFQGLAETVHYHGCVVAIMHTNPVHFRHSEIILKNFIHFCLVLNLRVFRVIFL